jgi:PAS domain S-box-containing protein
MRNRAFSKLVHLLQQLLGTSLLLPILLHVREQSEKGNEIMTQQAFAVFDAPKEEIYPQLSSQSEPTQTIDLQGLFAPDFSASGVVDLRSIGCSALGKLLEALPIPIMLVDQWFFVAFANSAFSKISPDYREIHGERFIDVLPSPKDEQRRRVLMEKTTALLERVFADRKPARAEAILEIGGKRIWARLHLRSIRVNSDRHIMVMIEDVTSERSQQRISERDEKKLLQIVQETKTRLRQMNEELYQTSECLKREIAEHAKTKDALSKCLE